MSEYARPPLGSLAAIAAAAEMARESANKAKTDTEKLPLSCDQVAWLHDVLDRYDFALRPGHPPISRSRDAARLSAMLEIMEILGFEFADDTARGNAISRFPELRNLVPSMRGHDGVSAEFPGLAR